MPDDLTKSFMQFMETEFNVQFVDVTPDPVCKHCNHSIYVHDFMDYSGEGACCDCTNFEKMELSPAGDEQEAAE